MIMKNKTSQNKASLNETNESKECGCSGHEMSHGHCHCKKPIVIGLVLLAAGAMLESGYNFAQVIMLIGGIMIVKGIILTAMRKDR
jgi:hypothetical protein